MSSATNAAVGPNVTKNYSILAVPLAFAACLLPHFAAVLMLGLDKYDNSNPRGFRDLVQRDTSIEKTKKQRILRVHAAAANGFETLGYFSAGVLAANYSQVETRWLNALAFGYIAVRVVYIFGYVFIQNRRLSWLRTAVWEGSVAVMITLWVKAGLKVLHGGR